MTYNAFVVYLLLVLVVSVASAIAQEGRDILRKTYLWVRFGTIRTEVRDRIDWLVCEEAYFGRGNKLIGYWAYGNFDPHLPYQGE